MSSITCAKYESLDFYQNACTTALGCSYTYYGQTYYETKIAFCNAEYYCRNKYDFEKAFYCTKKKKGELIGVTGTLKEAYEYMITYSCDYERDEEDYQYCLARKNCEMSRKYDGTSDK